MVGLVLIFGGIAIIVLGPRFSNMLKRWFWIGTAKRYVSNIQNEVSNLEIDEEKIDKEIKKTKKMSNEENEGGFVSHLTELRKD